MSAPGYNPIRWRCESDGCFNVLKRPKIEVFSECFPGRISFGDVDGIVEISGMALLLEWKPAPGTLRTGQRIMYENLSRDGKITVLTLAGDAKTMAVTHSGYFWAGKQSEWKPATIEDARSFCKRWAGWAKRIAEWRDDYERVEQEEKRG